MGDAKVERRDGTSAPWRLLAALWLAALLVRIGLVLSWDMPSIVGYSESGMVAKNLVEGRGFTFDLFGVRQEQPLRSYLPPLFPALLAFCLYYFANPELALGLLQALLSSLTALFGYFVAQRLAANRFVGLLAMMAIAFYPPFILMSAYPPSLSVELFLLALLLLIVTALPQTPSWRLALLAGVVLGLNALVRPTLLGLTPVLVLWVGLVGSRSWPRMLRLGGWMAAGALVVILPWTVRNGVVQGKLVLIATNGGSVFWHGNNPFTTGSGMEVYTARLAAYRNQPVDPQQPAIIESFPYPLPHEIEGTAATLNEVALEQAFYRAGWQFILQDPARWRSLLWAKLRGFWWFRDNLGMKYSEEWTRYYQWLYSALLILVAPGVWFSLRRWRWFCLLYLLYGYHMVVYLTYHIQMRYRWVIEQYLLIFAALTVATLAHWWLGPRLRPAPVLGADHISA